MADFWESLGYNFGKTVIGDMANKLQDKRYDERYKKRRESDFNYYMEKQKSIMDLKQKQKMKEAEEHNENVKKMHEMNAGSAVEFNNKTGLLDFVPASDVKKRKRLAMEEDLKEEAVKVRSIMMEEVKRDIADGKLDDFTMTASGQFVPKDKEAEALKAEKEAYQKESRDRTQQQWKMDDMDEQTGSFISQMFSGDPVPKGNAVKIIQNLISNKRLKKETADKILKLAITQGKVYEPKQTMLGSIFGYNIPNGE